MALRSVTVLLGLTALACTAGTDKPGGDDTGLDTSGGDDTGGGDDTSGGDDTGGGGAGCPDYSGLTGAGASRSFRYTYGGGLVIETEWEVVAWNLPSVTVQTTSSYEAGGQPYATTSVLEYRCVAGDGLYLDQVASTTEGAGMVTDSTTVYDPPARVMPYGVGTGDTWTSTYLSTTTSSTNGGAPVESSGSSSTDVTAGAEETVETAAGTFTARRFDSVSSTSGGGQTSTTWWADAALGVVKDSYGELVAYD